MEGVEAIGAAEEGSLFTGEELSAWGAMFQG